MRLGMFQIGKKLHDDNLVIDPRFKQKLYKQIFNEGTTTTMAKKHLQLDFKQLVKQRRVLYSGGLALALLATTAWYALDNRHQSLARQTEIEKVVELPKNLEGVLSADQMQTLATTDAPAGTTVTGVEIENEHGTVLYKVKFSDGSYRLYDAKTGLAYVDPEKKEAAEDEHTIPAGFVAGVTLQQARDIAAAQRPGKTITKIELETENGVVVYSVRFSDDGRVDVNAKDGSVIRVRSGSSSTAPSTASGSSSNDDSNDSVDSEDHAEEDTEDDGDRSGSDDSGHNEDDNDDSGSDSSGGGSGSGHGGGN